MIKWFFGLVLGPLALLCGVVLAMWVWFFALAWLGS